MHLLYWFYLLLRLTLLAQSEVPQSRVVVPGVVHTQFVNEGPTRVQVLEVDLTHPSLAFESYRSSGLVPTSKQAAERQAQGVRVVAAINADFFSFTTTFPLGNQVLNGEFVMGTDSRRSHVMFDARGRPYFERARFTGALMLKTGTSISLAGVNRGTRRNALSLYSRYWEARPRGDSTDVEYVLRLVGQPWRVSDTMRVVVVTQRQSAFGGSVPLATDEIAAVISGDSLVGLLQQSIALGDTVALYLGLEPRFPNIRHVLGGGGRLLHNGVYDSTDNIQREGLNADFLARRHPRTFMGINKDTTRLYLCVVDGRQESSIGMNFREMAEFLLSIGAWNAINLDGGGSTTMVVDGRIMNSPSDPQGERGVANSLLVVLRE